MNSTVTVIDPTALDNEAADWLVAQDRGLTAQEAAAFTEWLGRSAAHAEVWDHAKRTWDSYGAPDPAAFEALRQDALAMGPPLWRRPLPMALAAVALAVVVAAATWILRPHP